ncbi:MULTISPECIES: conjugal transfer transcriptional regulator TraJ [Burkholderiaceae]|uniref:conjugal transfer transcriptional regulator TraJ n=1 Tax=Burkholderiaceae TaxID=119060 RepID=UPI00047F31AF|nr:MULTISPECIES: conjugal transfer transcriptional regulator TraJ [Burkholderiaceae]KVE55362.1 conjugal transfer protein TraJ [Burkholderia vietnamiensis]KVE85888.1 conjugal transfer protein TraJ [Burkholderia vietnamiensis]MCL4632814.1 conjugal transfer transcriptional regulator TraJ [Burkholderia sp.]MCW3657678.1 conjugal transfer transcriptional regulator TraJ [Burkholderia cenocepacia]MDN7927485.1 conjugal transfer transcriptional regulator TraJ [Burkholderia vietnamiensis]
MEETVKAATRKGTTPIKVYCLPDERAEIETLAAASGNSASTYLRLVGLGYRVEGIVDAEQVRELVRVNGDLGRLGGLLKLWLTNDARVAGFTPATIHALLSRIEATRDEMSHIMESVMRPRGR